MADLRNKFKVGDIVIVKETIPGDGNPKSFYLEETFPITRAEYNEEQDVTYVFGGHFDFAISGERVELTEEDWNPWPLCRDDLPWVKMGNAMVDLKMMAIQTFMKNNPGRTMVVVNYLTRNRGLSTCK